MMTAASARAELRQNMEYGRAEGVSLRLDAEIPPGAGPFPAVIIVHGGAWVSGDRRYSVQPLFHPLANAGFAWFSISYRLASNVEVFGDAVHDVEQAVRYVRAHAAEYHVDAGRIALVGESAGAQLAAMAALGPEGRDVKAVVSLYGPTDLVTLARTSTQIPESIRRSVAGTPFESLLLGGLAQWSPINHVAAGMPPFLLIHGTSDSLVPFEQSVSLCDKARQAGGSCEVYPVNGGGHGLRWWEADHLTAYKRHMVDWLERELGSGQRAAAPVHRRSRRSEREVT
jgi:alpha-L-fucosidase 2